MLQLLAAAGSEEMGDAGTGLLTAVSPSVTSFLNVSDYVIFDNDVVATDNGTSPLTSFSQRYQRYHGYVSAVVCVCGITVSKQSIDK